MQPPTSAYYSPTGKVFEKHSGMELRGSNRAGGLFGGVLGEPDARFPIPDGGSCHWSKLAVEESFSRAIAVPSRYFGRLGHPRTRRQWNGRKDSVPS